MSFPVTTRCPQTAADWTAANPTLDQFEVGIEINPATGAYERAKLGDGRTAWADLAYWNPSGGPKVYRALLTQTGTDAPVATVLENTLGGAIVWTYETNGGYAGACVGAFTAGKTCISPVTVANSMEYNALTVCSLNRTGADNLTLLSASLNAQEGTLTLADDLLVNACVEILVYP